MFRSQSGDTMICVQSSKSRKPKNFLAIFWANLFNWNGVDSYKAVETGF